MEAKEQIKAAILYLSGRCDGAVEQDGIGFNGTDSKFGKSLADSISFGVTLTTKQLEVALKMLRKYEKTQLADAGLSLPASSDLQLELTLVKQLNCKREMKLAGDKVIIEFDYDDTCYKTVKSMGGKFNPVDKSWMFPDSKLDTLLEKLVPLGFKPCQEILNHLELINEEKRIERENLQARVDWCMAHLESESEEWDFKPYRHQWEGVDFILSQPNLSAIVASSAGVGKTAQALIAAKAIKDFYRFEYDECPAVIVLCPVSLKLNWFKEAEKVRLKIEVFSHAKVPTPPQSKKFILIADESHSFKNPKAARTQKFLDLALNENCISCIPMTATPMINGRHHELYTTLKAVKHPIADNRKYYEIRYCDAKPTTFNPWDTTGSINAEELSTRIADKMIRHTKEQCLDLPEKVFISLFCEPNKDADQEYQENLAKLKEEYLERLKRKEINYGGEQLVTIGQLRKCSSIRKSYQAIETAQGLIDAGQPVVIFTEFRESAQRIADHFGVQPLNGDTKLADRQQMVDDFQSGKNNIFVGTIAAGGVGITLTRASYLIMMDSPWNPGLYTQATDRCIVQGQLVHTQDGMKPIEEICVGHKVLTHNGLYRTVIGTSSRYHRDRITTISYKRYFKDLVTTHDHKILAKKENDDCANWYMASDLKPGDYLCFPRNRVYNHLEKIEISGYLKMINKSAKKPIPNIITVDERLLKLFGWYLAEGFSSICTENKSAFISLSGHVDEENYIKDIAVKFDEWGINWSIYHKDGSNGIELRAYSKPLAEFFVENFGRLGSEMKLPDMLLNLTLEQTKILVDSYIKGDGYVRNNQTEWVSKSSSLCSQIALLFSKLGFNPSIRYVVNHRHQDCWIGMVTHTQNDLADEYTYNKITKTTTEYCEKRDKIQVYDLTVENDHSFVVGNAIVHNCHRIGQINKCTIYDVYYSDIDYVIAALINRKGENVDRVINEKIGKIPDKIDSAFYEKLLKKLLGS